MMNNEDNTLLNQSSVFDVRCFLFDIRQHYITSTTLHSRFWPQAVELLRLLLCIQRYKDKRTLDNFFTTGTIHFFSVYFYINIYSDILYFLNLPDYLHDGIGLYGFHEFDLFRINREHSFTGKAGGGDIGDFIHPFQDLAAENGIVGIEHAGEYGFKLPGNTCCNSIFHKKCVICSKSNEFCLI